MTDLFCPSSSSQFQVADYMVEARLQYGCRPIYFGCPEKTFFLSQELTIDFCRAAINFNSSQHLLSAHASTTVHTCRSSFSRKYTIKIVWGLVCGLVVGQVSFSAM